MTEFEHRPIQKVIIDQIVKKTYDGFVDDVVGIVEHPALWVDGILFTFFRHPDSETVFQKGIEDAMRYWDILVFCKCEKMPKVIKRQDYHNELPVRNMQDNPVFVQMARWLKKQPVWEESRASSMQVA